MMEENQLDHNDSNLLMTNNQILNQSLLIIPPPRTEDELADLTR